MALDHLLVERGTNPNRVPTDFSGEWTDQLAWAVDSALAADRLANAGRFVAAARQDGAVMTLPIKFHPKSPWISIGDSYRRQNGDGVFVIMREDLPNCSATEMKNALRAASLLYDEASDEELLVSTVPDEAYDAKYGPTEQVSFSFSVDDQDLELRVPHFDDRYEDRIPDEAFVNLLTPFAARHGLTLKHVTVDEYIAGPPWLWHITFHVNTRGRTLQPVFAAGEACSALLEAFAGGELRRDTVSDLVRGGNVAALLDQPESAWLEAKSQHYALDTDSGQIALAHAVARFCNAEQGGLVIVGLKTKKSPSGEHISAVSPMPIDHRTVRRYRQVIQNRLFPLPDFLKIETVKIDERSEIVVIDVPTQPEEHKPFLVHGAIVEGKVHGAFISIVRRHDDTTVPTTAAAIHATLAAGRALLRHGRLPNDPPDEIQDA